MSRFQDKSVFQDKYLSISYDNLTNSISITNKNTKDYSIHNKWPNEPLSIPDGTYTSESYQLTMLNKSIQHTLVIPQNSTIVFKKEKENKLEVSIEPIPEHPLAKIRKENPVNYVNIYFLMAFNPTFINFIKFLLCLSIQLSVAPLIIYEYIFEQYQDIISIDQTSIIYKIVACLFCLNIIFNYLKSMSILVYPITAIQQMHHNGQMLREVNMFYYLIGYYVNILITIFSYLSAIFIVFTANSPIRIILNGFAITVVNNIDDNIITQDDLMLVQKKMKALSSIRNTHYLLRPISIWLMSIINYIVVGLMISIPVLIIVFNQNTL